MASPAFGDVQRELEELKLRLAAMEAPDLPEREAVALATEISAIRLQLKRLAAERRAVDQAYRDARGG